MQERQLTQVKFLKHKARVHKISFVEAVKRYAEQFDRLWSTFNKEE